MTITEQAEKPALSNSRSASLILGIGKKIENNGFTISLDKMSITADISQDNAIRVLRIIEFEGGKIPKFSHLSDKYEATLDVDNSTLFVTYDKRKEAIDVRPFRIEFNPNFVSEDGQDFILSLLDYAEKESLKISRLDIAFDSEQDLSDYRFVNQNTKTTIFRGQTGEVETLYYGSESSTRMIRLYNKKQQMIDTNGEILGSDDMWRFEIVLRHDKVDNWRNMLHNVTMIKNDFKDVSLVEEMALYAMLNEPNYFSRLGKNTKTKYRKLMKSKSTSNLTAQMQAAINNVENELAEMINSWVDNY